MTAPKPEKTKSSMPLPGVLNKITPDIIEDATIHLLVKIKFRLKVMCLNEI